MSPKIAVCVAGYLAVALSGCTKETPVTPVASSPPALAQPADPGLLSATQEANLRATSEKLVEQNLPAAEGKTFGADATFERNSMGGYLVSGTIASQDAAAESEKYVVSYDDMHGKMPRVVIVNGKLLWKALSLPADAEELDLVSPEEPAVEAKNEATEDAQ